eukprot:TRINITY_DN50908_c0_g1_i1.p1 TRINITY_DN50908_c0_g1~~TRINITY_DN50908_c0_g1_i1.p1  ORF type:complete len:736 (-),score=149.10 TRINITY_DN50908_c0_g1_i1:583-2694(-)
MAHRGSGPPIWRSRPSGVSLPSRWAHCRHPRRQHERPRDFQGGSSSSGSLMTPELRSLLTGVLVGCSRQGRVSRRLAFVGSRGATASDAQPESADSAAAELQNEIRRLQSEKASLLRQLSSSSNDVEGFAAGGAVQEEYVDGSDEDLRGVQSRFAFPETDLPWPPEHIRLAAPREDFRREPFQLRTESGDATGSVEAPSWVSVFRSAAPYIAAFRGGTVVVHVPSFLTEDEQEEAFRGIMEDLAFCSLLGMKIVVVTSFRSRLARRLQMEGDHGGYRGQSLNSREVVDVERLHRDFPVDEDAIRVARQEAGYVRVEVESALMAGFKKRTMTSFAAIETQAQAAGLLHIRGPASVISGQSFFTTTPLADAAPGSCAGTIRSVQTSLIQQRLDEGDIVSLTPLGPSQDGQVLFVSSEELAAKVATALRAIKLVYITRGQRLVDTRKDDNLVIAGLQVNNAAAFLSRLRSDMTAKNAGVPLWFAESIRHLHYVTGAVSPNGVRRGHLVDPSPGAVLQEFYTTDGSGTCIAQDLYQGLRKARASDAARISELFSASSFMLGAAAARNSEVLRDSIRKGELFVWRRDDSVLGCGQLAALDEAAAELRLFAVAKDATAAQADALLAYAERVAVTGGASELVVSCIAAQGDFDYLGWLARHRFLPQEGTAWQQSALVASEALYSKPLDAGSIEEAQSGINEEQRMWGGVA